MASQIQSRPETCQRKKAYQTFRHAANDARAIRHKSHEFVDVYHCRNCQQFHIGHPWTPEGKI